MNILIINGSPRIHGNISAMLDAIREEAEQRGAEVTTVLASRLQVNPVPAVWPAVKPTIVYCPKTMHSVYLLP